MPYADPQDKLQAMRRWRREVMPKGYGKWLYARRKLRFDDADRFRAALEYIMEAPSLDDAQMRAALALNESAKAERALGPWVADE